MVSAHDSIGDIHWLLGILQHIDVGLVVLDRQYHVQLWNGFMENHSGKRSRDVLGRDLFMVFPNIPEKWLRRKVEAAFLLKNRSFTTWQQRPYLLRFDSYRPITGGSEWMYQNVSMFPLSSPSGRVDHVCLIIYDVTDMALDELALQQANAELEWLGRTDGLTGLNNRRAWQELLEAEFRRHTRGDRPTVLAMFDIDHFKRINDTYGHQVGDEVIRAVARAAAQVKRETDYAGRYGGEEFGVVLVETGIEGGLQFAERLRLMVEEHPVVHDGQAIHCTISVGLAELTADLRSSDEWVDRADQALYRSKAAGRNRTTVYR